MKSNDNNYCYCTQLSLSLSSVYLFSLTHTIYSVESETSSVGLWEFRQHQEQKKIFKKIRKISKMKDVLICLCFLCLLLKLNEATDYPRFDDGIFANVCGAGTYEFVLL